MDYCHACHRHLNGALACAGCGTPAEYLTAAAPAPAASAGAGAGAGAGSAGPVAGVSPYAPGAVPYAGSGPDSGASPYARPAYEDVTGPAPGSPAGVVEDGSTLDGSTSGGYEHAGDDALVVLAAPHSGRPGARRGGRGASGRRRRRRTAMTAGLGLLLAALGSFALARLTAEAPAGDRASTVMLTDDTPPDQGPAPGVPTAAPTLGQAPTKSAGTAAPVKATGTAGATRSPGASASSATTGPSQSAAPTGPGPTASAGPTSGPTGPGTRPPGNPAPPPVSPTPTPTATPPKPCGFFDKLFGLC
ncbi:hypothetical protein [Streptomyces sp. NPDC090022]|uniref:SCO2400 family protein n=1 Tax=Streptomyces sp. NPDC090022 TaxID=3365920 RepID=UPI0037F84B82